MRNILITYDGDLHDTKGNVIVCPMMANGISCTATCAWYTEKSVTRSDIGAFCGDKFIGNLERDKE